jgi:hypothetical protein
MQFPKRRRATWVFVPVISAQEVADIGSGTASALTTQISGFPASSSFRKTALENVLITRSSSSRTRSIAWSRHHHDESRLSRRECDGWRKRLVSFPESRRGDPAFRNVPFSVQQCHCGGCEGTNPSVEHHASRSPCKPNSTF